MFRSKRFSLTILFIAAYSWLLQGCAGVGHRAPIFHHQASDCGNIVTYFHKYDNGNTKYQYTLVDGIISDTVYAYSKNGRLKAKSTYKNGKLEGKGIYYFDNGQVRYETHYTNNKKNGTEVSYHKNGAVHYRAHYENGVQNYYNYHEFDSLGDTTSQWYAKSANTFIFTSFDSSGKTECEIKNNRLNGACTTYDNLGLFLTKYFYAEGKPDSTICAPTYKYKRRKPRKILKVIRKKTSELRHIYNHFLLIQKLEGRIIVKFWIAPNGRVIKIILIKNLTGSPHFAIRMLKSLSTLKFGQIKGKGNDIVTIPFTFSK